MRIAGINVYPVKSGAGVPLEAAELTPMGLSGDRRWLVADEEGVFVTQRQLPALARLRAVPTAAGLRLELDGEGIDLALPPAGGPRVPARVWRDGLDLPEVAEAASWLSPRLGRPLRLLHQPEDAIRPVSHEWGAEGDRVSMADGFPILVATTASLEAVRAAAGPEIGPWIGMERFRPNLVVDGAEPWAEDGWARLAIGGVVLDLVKPCARCPITTTDQALGEVTGPEPLATLRRLRRSGDPRVPGLLFGWNAIPRRLGTVRLGDAVEVLETRAPWPILLPGRQRQFEDALG
jgi:uncharacterized protein YcbX